MLRTAAAMEKYCKEHNIHHGDASSFEAQAFGGETSDVKTAFEAAYALSPIEGPAFKERGASTILVMERPENETAYHGQAVAAIAAHVGRSLNPAIHTIHVHNSINPAYRMTQYNERAQHNAVTYLLENNGAAVINTSLGWEDNGLTPHPEPRRRLQEDHLSSITAFVVDSAGNDGAYGQDGKRIPAQKHNAASHMPPLVVHVGAVEKDGEHYHIPGYSSANSPTFVAPIKPQQNIYWKKEKAEPITGTSAATPYVSGGLAALNEIYGRYLTREHILHAVMATCKLVDQVDQDDPKTPQAQRLTYTKNACGLKYNPTYAGFGCVDFQAAVPMLNAMAAYAQAHTDEVKVPEDHIVTLTPAEQEVTPNAEGKYTYTLDLPPGVAQKMSFHLLYQNDRGKSEVSVASPSGTTLPLVLSQHLKDYGISTTHGWEGEAMEGTWTITTDAPLKGIRLVMHHFHAQDLVRHFMPNIAQPEVPPLNLDTAKPLSEILNLSTEQLAYTCSEMDHGIRVNDIAIASATPDEVLKILHYAPEGIDPRARGTIHTAIDYNLHQASSTGQALEAGVRTLAPGQVIESAKGYENAAAAYAKENLAAGQANMLSLAAQAWMQQPESCDEAGKLHAERAMGLFADAIGIHQKQGHLDHVYRDTTLRYGALMAAARYYSQKDNLDKATEYLDQAEQIIGTIRAQAITIQGGEAPQARRVEAGEMAFSSREPIGTDSVHSGLLLVAQSADGTSPNPYTGLVHLRPDTDLATLDRFFEHFPEGKLNLRLVGARSPTDEVANGLLERVIDHIKDREINIISADVGLGDWGPTAVVVNPADFTLTAKVPTHSEAHWGSYEARSLLGGAPKGLTLAYDDASNSSPLLRDPVFLDAAMVKTLREKYVGKSLIEIDAAMARDGVAERPLRIAQLRELMWEYEHALVPVLGALERKKNAISSMCGSAASESRYLQACATVRQHGIYIGPGAGEANQSLIAAAEGWMNNGAEIGAFSGTQEAGGWYSAMDAESRPVEPACVSRGR